MDQRKGFPYATKYATAGELNQWKTQMQVANKLIVLSSSALTQTNS
jgi:hypothetical protein